MKVIREGNKNSMEVTCGICCAVLEIQASDLTAQGASTPPTLFLYKCPCCKRNNGIHLSELNINMRKEISQLFT